MTENDTNKILGLLERIALALESQSGMTPETKPDFTVAGAFIWSPNSARIKPVHSYKALPANLLVGLDDQLETLTKNTEQFAKGFSANNALLWGARGMGKSSAVKSVHAELKDTYPLKLIEIHREDLSTLEELLDLLRAASEFRFILFCDDLSFDERDSSYKSLKAVLEGGLQGRPENVIIYATSNRRHLLPRDMIENERRTAIHGGEAVEEKVSLSDRFGLWLGFYPCEHDQYFTMVENYASALGIEIGSEQLHARALEWSMLRGARSGRVAWQFIQDLAGQAGIDQKN